MEFLWREWKPCGKGHCEGADQRRSTLITTRDFDRPPVIDAFYQQESMGAIGAQVCVVHSTPLDLSIRGVLEMAGPYRCEQFLPRKRGNDSYRLYSHRHFVLGTPIPGSDAHRVAGA